MVGTGQATFDGSGREITLLFELTAAISRAEHVRDIHVPTLEAMFGLLTCQRAAMLLADERRALHVHAVRGLGADGCASIEGVVPWPSDSFEPAPLLIGDVDAGPSNFVCGPLRTVGVRSFALIPLMHGNRLLGALLFASDQPRHLDVHEVQLATNIASHVAQALSRAQLFDAEQQARAAAELAVRAREDILAVVSHDLRNPLGAVLMTAESLLAFGTEVDEETWLKIARIKRAAERMAHLIDDLVDFGSIQAGKLTIDARAWAPAELAATAIDLLAGFAEERHIDLHSAVGNDLPLVRCDRERTVQVLSNLLGNAVKVTPPGGSVVVSATQSEAEVELCVADTGPGIEPDELPHVFERYWRSRKAGYRGSGLGLTIAGALVQAQGGRIRAESTPGAGSRFYFTLPDWV